MLTPDQTSFPDLYREDAMELPAVGALSLIGAGLILPCAPILSIPASLPFWYWLTYSLSMRGKNFQVRRAWANTFPRQLTCRQFRALLRAEPLSRYILHVRHYGGFDVVHETPAMILQDQTTGEQMAIHPSRWKVLRLAEAHRLVIHTH